MRKDIITGLIIICITYIGSAQNTQKPRHAIRPVVSYSYLPTWALDDYHGNTKANFSVTGIYAFKEMGKESYFSLGLMFGKYKDVEDEEHTGLILPIQLHKFFNTDRTGFNLGFGLLINYCASCGETFGATYAQEINYMFFRHPLRVNVGLQTMLGNLFTEPAIHIGPQLQLMWIPEPKKKR